MSGKLVNKWRYLTGTGVSRKLFSCVGLLMLLSMYFIIVAFIFGTKGDKLVFS